VSGTAVDPIVVRAAAPGDATLRLDSSLVLFQLSEPHWIFENLEIEGTCANHDDCMHALQMFGDADFTEIRDSVIRDFNVPIRGNGFGGLFPDDVVISGVELRNTTARNTANPVTMIEAIGGQRWIVRDNVLADFGKSQGNLVSYALVLRGNSRDGLIERNLIVCEDAHTEGVRLGVSLGGGGSAPDSFCEGGTCAIEHTNGIIRNNFILQCPDDAGIYLNEASNTGIYHNTHIGSSITSILVRFAPTTGAISNNLTSGAITFRDGAAMSQSANLSNVPLSSFTNWFSDWSTLDFSLLDGSELVDQGVVIAAAPEDFCGNDRNDGSPDLGAVEYDADLGPCPPITVVQNPPVPLSSIGSAVLMTLLLAAGVLKGRRQMTA
jgi:hypothetical protein